MSIDNMIRTIKRLYKTPISEIENMYLDGIDYNGIIYWFKDAEDYIKEINKTFGGLI